MASNGVQFVLVIEKAEVRIAQSGQSYGLEEQGIVFRFTDRDKRYYCPKHVHPGSRPLQDSCSVGTCSCVPGDKAVMISSRSIIYVCLVSR